MGERENVERVYRRNARRRRLVDGVGNVLSGVRRAGDTNGNVAGERGSDGDLHDRLQTAARIV